MESCPNSEKLIRVKRPRRTNVSFFKGMMVFIKGCVIMVFIFQVKRFVEILEKAFFHGLHTLILKMAKMLSFF